ncbi:hypothetical protein OHO28_08380 [Streptomyces europaeiscabiei]|uniref:hypothetical protein n=1 Tax=Streptomyces europaeiscabiei TaxID=146819 RepID=UPI002E17157B
MPPSLAPAPAPDAERRTDKPRLRGRRRVLTVISVLLALLGGVIAGSGPAFAQTPPGSCTHTCNNPPGGVSQADWNHALQAADFWANSNINLHQTLWSGARSYYELDHTPGRGWPGAALGNNWYGYQTAHGNQFIYYGGTYNDWNGTLSWYEQNTFHVSAARAFTTYTDRFGVTHTAPYVEYDTDSYTAARTSRNAWRIVRNVDTGHTFVTYDHYASFYYLGQY